MLCCPLPCTRAAIQIGDTCASLGGAAQFGFQNQAAYRAICQVCKRGVCVPRHCAHQSAPSGFRDAADAAAACPGSAAGLSDSWIPGLPHAISIHAFLFFLPQRRRGDKRTARTDVVHKFVAGQHAGAGAGARLWASVGAKLQRVSLQQPEQQHGLAAASLRDSICHRLRMGCGEAKEAIAAPAFSSAGQPAAMKVPRARRAVEGAGQGCRKRCCVTVD
jgi:hypothetical protein